MTIAEMKRQQFGEIAAEIERQNGVYVLSRNDEWCYISFVYRRHLWYLQAAEYYPFTDTNHPSEWNYTVSAITGINEKAQLTYFEAWAGFENLKINKPRNKPLTTGQKIDVLLSNEERVCKAVIAARGGEREKAIIQNGAFMAKGETWNAEHKVVNILSLEPDEDGYWPGFQIDVVTRIICG